MCFLSLEGKKSFLSSVQISLSLKLLITSWSLSRLCECLCILCILLYILYVISSAPAALLHILVLGTEIFDMNQDAKVSQKSVCAYVYIHLKYTQWCVCTIRYALLG